MAIASLDLLGPMQNDQPRDCDVILAIHTRRDVQLYMEVFFFNTVGLRVSFSSFDSHHRVNCNSRYVYSSEANGSTVVVAERYCRRME